MSEIKRYISQEKGEGWKVKLRKLNKMSLTNHAKERMSARNIPHAMIEYAISNGKRIILPDREAYRFELNNVLGVRGKTLVVIQGFNGNVLTSYLEKSMNKTRKS